MLTMYLRWRLATLKRLVLVALSFVYGPDEPLPCVLRAGIEESHYGSEYLSAQKREQLAERLRNRQTAISSELDVRSHAVVHRRS